MKIKFTLSFILLISIYSFSQEGVIKGRVFNEINNEPIPYATVVIENTELGTTTSDEGEFILEGLKLGTVTISASFLGFKTVIFYDVIINNTKTTIIDFPLTEEASILTEVELKSSPFKRSLESPISRQTISASEIYRNPGSNRDISKVIQILPGVATTPSFRNDIIVRGGAPNENKFYLDGIEIPNINHFATQGSSGGPVGMLNVNFIKDVEFYSGAFPASKGNTLSSLIEFEQIEGNKEKLSGTFLIGSSDVGLTLEGPVGKKSSFILSARRSYLQYLFEALKLPFLPTYNDFQYKHDIEINKKNKITIIGLGAIDNFELNTDVNNDVTDEDDFKRNQYILANIPVNSQWNYTVGANWKHYSSNSYQNYIVSRNHLSNSAIKYRNNEESPEMLLLEYDSQEIENKFRFENTTRKKGWKWNYGVGLEHDIYKNTTFNKKEINGNIETIDFNSEISLTKYALFGQISQRFMNSRLALSAGIRTDFNNYSDEMSNPINQLSPRLSASYSLTNKLNLNFNIGRYYQLPAYTVLGYRNNDNVLVNKQNNITYIESDHIVAGMEYKPTTFSRVTLEGFYKKYDNYPFLVNDSISLANLGGDFGVIGNEPAKSISKGRTYGVELMMQQKLSSTIYGILSYTFVRSEFHDKNEQFIPSSWDNKHILNVVVGKKLKRNWEIGAKFRLLGGAPYTPYDVALSSQKEIWNVTQQGVYDWDKLNTQRNSLIHSLDVRIDKKWYFEGWSLNAYLDIVNIYNATIENPPYLDVKRDTNGNPLEDPSNPLLYETYFIQNDSGSILPSIGLMIGF